jgi:glycosyltransferase involved in cell wall biosynthesis
MECFAAGLPVVTADAPVTAELVEHEKTGLLTPFEDPPALAAALRRLCFDDALHAACRAEIARRLPDYSWTKRGEKLAGFAARIANPTPSRASRDCPSPTQGGEPRRQRAGAPSPRK